MAPHSYRLAPTMRLSVAGIAATFFLTAGSIIYLHSQNPQRILDSHWGILPLIAPIIAICVFIAALLWFLAYRQAPPWVIGIVATTLLGLIVVTPLVVEGTPRFNYNFVVLKEYNQFIDAGLQPDVIRDHNWPGLFAFLRVIHLVLGASLLDIARFTPLVTQLSFLLIIAAAGTSVGLQPQKALLVGVVAVVLNWVGQDFVALQNMGLLLFAVSLVAIARIYLSGLTLSRTFSLVVIASALAIVHLLSALMICALLGLVTLLRYRAGLKTEGTLPITIAMIFVAWNVTVSSFFLKVGQGPFLNVVRLRFLFVFSETFDDTADLSISASEVHNWLAAVKVITALAAILLAVWGALLFRRSPAMRQQVAGACLIVGASTSTLAFGPYGGEILFRIYLFAIPGLAFLIVLLNSGNMFTRVVFAGFLILSPATFVVNHYANEYVDYTPPSSIAGAEFVLSHVQDEARMLSPGEHVLGIGRNYVLQTNLRVEYLFLTSRPELVVEFLGERTHSTAAIVLPKNEVFSTLYHSGQVELRLGTVVTR